MSNNQSTIRERSTQHAARITPKSWHHRMARLIADAYRPKCGAANCEAAAIYVCEWDQMQGKKIVAAHKLYCADHAANFAAKHNIYMADLPDVPLSQLETASRDGWKYSDDKQRTEGGGRKAESLSSVHCHPSSEIKSEER